MSRSMKPPNLKAIAGTERPSRVVDIVDLPLVTETPQAPDWLPNAHAVKEWDRLAPILVANKLLSKGGTSALGMLCALHGKIVQLYAAGEAPNANMVGQYRGLINDFGLTPVAQGKVRQIGSTEPENPFSKNGKAKACTPVKPAGTT